MSIWSCALDFVTYRIRAKVRGWLLGVFHGKGEAILF